MLLTAKFHDVSSTNQFSEALVQAEANKLGDTIKEAVID